MLSYERVIKLLVELKYTENIDKVFRLLKHETNHDFERLQPMIDNDVDKFDRGYRNLKSYIEDLQELEDERTARNSYRLEQLPQQA